MPNEGVLAGVCSKAEIEAMKQESELRGLKYRAAQLRVMSLDANLAVAVAENDKVRAESISADLKTALIDLEALRVFETFENIRVAQLISSFSEQN
jgi:hypothetical protein